MDAGEEGFFEGGGHVRRGGGGFVEGLCVRLSESTVRAFW